MESYCCCCSVTQLFPTLRDLMECSMPGLRVPHHLLEFAQVHVHRIGDTIQPSHPLMPSSPSTLSLSQHQGLFQWFVCLHRWQNIGASASASVLPASIQGWFPLRLTGLISLQSKGYHFNGNIYTTMYNIHSQWGFAVWLRNVKLGLYKNLKGLDGIGGEREI